MVNEESQNTNYRDAQQKAYLLKTRFRNFRKILAPSNALSNLKPIDEASDFAIDRIGGSAVGSHIDKIIPVPGLDEGMVVQGWAVDVLNQNIPKAVLVQVDDLLFKCEVGLSRPDVARSKGESAYAFCGFEVNLPRGLFEDGSHQLKLQIITNDGRYYSSPEVTFRMVGFNPWMEKTDDEVVFHQSKEEVIKNLYQHLKTKDQQIDQMYQSGSWRITKPFRWLLDQMFLLQNIFAAENFRNGWQLLKEQGPMAFWVGLKQFLGVKLFGKKAIYISVRDSDYQRFIKRNTPDPKAISGMKQEAKAFALRPKISIITPVYNTDPQWLDLCIQSVMDQYYDNWEHCLHDDCSTNPATIKCLQKWAKQDARIKISLGKDNQHISGASNEAIKLATGDFIGLLDHDDEITPDALYQVVRRMNAHPETDVFYSDEDKLEMNGSLSGPYFKPDFNKDLLLSNNYMCHFTVVRKTLGDGIGWFRKGFEGSQDYDLFLRLIEKSEKVRHIPKVLYHWRKIPGSTAAVYDDKSYANQASLNALSEFLKRNRIDGKVENGLWPGSFRIRRELPKNAMISIIIPFKDQNVLLKECVSSILEKSTFQDYEILLVNNASQKAATKSYLDSLDKEEKVRVMDWNQAFNFAALNNAAAQEAKGEYLLFLNNDTEVLSPDWMETMLEQAQRPEVAAVGAKLLFANGTVQHAGVLLGVGGLANHAFLNFHKDDNRYYGNSNVIRNYSACSAACLMVSKKQFEAVEGMDEILGVAYNDVDLCLKFREKGWSIVYTPFAQLYHHESKSRGYELSAQKKNRLEKESEYLRNKWGSLLENDPFYNPNLNKKRPDFSLNED